MNARGLTEAEAAARAKRGESNRTVDVTSRSVGRIPRSNLFTRFNALLGSLVVVTLIVGPLQDALFGLVLIANALIGIGHELLAKFTLDRLAIVAAPGATVIRDGAARSVAVADVVMGDLLSLGAGDELMVDGELQSDGPIELN